MKTHIDDEADARTFCRPENFDCVLMLASAFGYFENPEENRQLLLNAHRSLKKNGVLVLKMVGKELTDRLLFTHWNPIKKEKDGWIVLEERKVAQNWERIEFHITMHKGDRRFKRVLTHELYSAKELLTIVTGCGFDSINIYGNYQGDPYDHLAE
ncbi:MAG: class I SAM-dependent methyltransferase [Candidatus Electrothrix sp. MAN1_4]|nr:class I SAM-dependent methyltransferase [Candidatus Electrothrix sp. MAN1_4]